MKNKAATWLTVGGIIAFLFVITGAIGELLESFAAPSAEAAGRTILFKYTNNSRSELKFFDAGGDPIAKNVRTILFRTATGETRFQIKVKPTYFGRWLERGYENLEL